MLTGTMTAPSVPNASQLNGIAATLGIITATCVPLHTPSWLMLRAMPFTQRRSAVS